MEKLVLEGREGIYGRLETVWIGIVSCKERLGWRLHLREQSSGHKISRIPKLLAPNWLIPE